MDKRIDMDDLYFALHTAARSSDLGITGIAENTGQRRQTLINKLNPQDVSHQPTLSDFVMVMKQANNADPLDTLCAMFGGQFISRSQQSGESIMAAVLKAMSEHGDIAKELEAAMADGEIDAAELSRLHREIREARNALIELENTLKDKCHV